MNSKRKYVEANKILGDKYKIVIIDLCWCLYKDFGNGYDVEINIEGTLKNIKEIQVFLWKQQPYQIVKTYYCDKIEEINDIVDKFYKDTQKYLTVAAEGRKEYAKKFKNAGECMAYVLRSRVKHKCTIG